MGKSKEGARSMFVFDFHEHHWLEEGAYSKESYNQVMFQHASSRMWEEVKSVQQALLNTYTNEEFASVEAFQTQAENELAVETGLEKAVFQSPFDKLKAMMNTEGWKFVDGWCRHSHSDGSEDNHGTQINVVLEKAKQKPPAKKATATQKAAPKKTPPKNPKAAKKDKKTVAKKKK